MKNANINKLITDEKEQKKIRDEKQKRLKENREAMTELYRKRKLELKRAAREIRTRSC